MMMEQWMRRQSISDKVVNFGRKNKSLTKQQRRWLKRR